MKPKATEIQTLNIDGLSGRMLHLPAPANKKRKIVIFYGLHSSIERMYTTALFHNQFGEVFMPDLPGFGGMDSFYTIGQKPSLDSYADYLYSFLKSQKFNKDITIIGMSFGFLAATRMFQKYPETTRYAKDVIAIVGFGRSSDFKVSIWLRRLILGLSLIFKTHLGAWFIRVFIFNPISLRAMFLFFRLFNPKYKHTLGEARKAAIKMELDLWQKNDARTKFYTWELILKFDLTQHTPPINLLARNMFTETDQYFDRARVDASFKLLYQDYERSVAKSVLHAPSVLASIEEVDNMYSQEIKQLLSSP